MSAVLAALGGKALGGIVNTVGSVIDDLHTSDEERAAAQLEDRKLDQQLQLGQQEINKEEAKHASLFVAGWRPYIGWIAGTALGLVYIPKALVMTGIWTYLAVVVVMEWNGIGTPTLPPFPDLGVLDLLGLLGTMLGMGGMRMVETLQGKARSEPLTPPPAIFRRKPPAELEAP
jgi:hypothetical protein